MLRSTYLELGYIKESATKNNDELGFDVENFIDPTSVISSKSLIIVLKKLYG